MHAPPFAIIAHKQADIIGEASGCNYQRPPLADRSFLNQTTIVNYTMSAEKLNDAYQQSL